MAKKRSVLWAGLAVLAVWLAIYFAFIRPPYMRWGATAEESARSLPGDDRAPQAALRFSRATTVEAPAEHVWSWISQLGIGRGGFYSYDWLENLFLAGIHNDMPEAPPWPERRDGEFVRSFRFGADKAGFNGWRYDLVEPGRAFFLDPGWGPFVCDPLGPSRTRLLVRSLNGARRPAAAFLLGLFFDPIHFTMEKRMLLSVKAMAEGRPAFSRWGTVAATVGFILAGLMAAAIILARRRGRLWILAPLAWPAAVAYFTRDPRSALVAFTAGGLIVAGFRLLGRRGWAWVLGFWIYALLVLIYVADAYVVFGLVFLALAVAAAGWAAGLRRGGGAAPTEP